MANMVFHLIPSTALDRAAADLASVVTPGGGLVWSSPDRGPAGEYSILFHDANRAVRARWLELLADARADGEAASPGRERSHAELSPELWRAIRAAVAGSPTPAPVEGQQRADRRVLPQANLADDVATALGRHFSGQVECQTHEILPADLLDTLLVPSNQSEYLSEIADRQLREQAIEELMLGDVLPRMRDQPAGTAVGLNIQWTLGSFTK
jgi:hypothetical protein